MKTACGEFLVWCGDPLSRLLGGTVTLSQHTKSDVRGNYLGNQQNSFKEEINQRIFYISFRRKKSESLKSLESIIALK